MALTINTNVPSLIAQNNLNRNVAGLEKVMVSLSTGLRINHAGDDAAGLAIAERAKCQIRGSSKAMDNIQDAKNFVNVAEGGMISVGDHLQRINELCIQAASDMYNLDGRKSLFQEVKQRLIEIDAIANGLQFNGQKLLDGSLAKMIIQIGAYSDTTGTSQINTLDIAPALSNCNWSALGANVTSGGVVVQRKNAYTGIAGITLPDWLDVDHNNGASFGDVLLINDGSAVQPVPADTHFGDAIRDYMVGVRSAMDDIAQNRGLIGAFSNRMDSTYENLSITVENLEVAKSRITDVDVAKASSEMVKYQILQQSTTAVLAQANQIPALALSLIRG